MTRHDGRTLLVTGAGRGIGAATVRCFLGAGANVVLADRDEATTRRLADELDPAGSRTRVVASDVTDHGASSALVGAALDAFGSLDYVVPAAGVYPEQPLASMTDEQWAGVMAVNLDPVFRLVRDAMPHLGPGGSIVLITSLAAHRGSLRHAHYAASKGALLSFGRSAAQEAPPGVRVNMVSPGIIATPMITDLLSERRDALLAATPLGRFGEASEVASVIDFLCGPESSFVHGAVIHVNGGLHIE